MKRNSKTVETETCPDCGGFGYVIGEHGAAPCGCRKQQEIGMLLRHSRIPRKFAGKSLKAFTTKSPQKRQIVEFAQNFLKTFRPEGADQPQKGLLLMGKEGTGKTHIAVAILREVVEKGYRGLFWNVPELFLELRRLMNDSGEDDNEGALFDEARSADLLVLDDLGAEKTSEFVLDRLYVLINGRYEKDKSTIVTTNRTLEELRQQLGPRIVSRLCEMCVAVEFPEGDYRLMNMR